MDCDAENLSIDCSDRPTLFAVAGRSVRLGFAASLAMHLVAVGLVVAIASTVNIAIAAFGNARPLSITATFSEQADPAPVPEESGAEQIIIRPTEVWQDDRYFVNTTNLPTTDHAADLPARAVPRPSLDPTTATRPTNLPRPEVAHRETDSARRRAVVSSEPAIAPVNLPPPDIRFVGRPCRYPAVAEQAGWEGTVELLITIAADGTVTDVAIFKSSGNGAADAEAVQTARAWRAVPTKTGGKIWATKVRKPIIFRL